MAISGFRTLPSPSCILFWSGGKDCAWALDQLIRSGVSVAALVTTFDRATLRIPIHNVAIDQIVLQAAAVRLPLWPVALPWPCQNDQYEQALLQVFEWAKGQSITRAAFGDLFLEDIRKFRERLLNGSGLQPVFPNWGIDTSELAHRMLAAGYRARVVAVDERVMSRDLVGREFDGQFLAGLPPGVDPCGENGEFHTFVYAGPIFSAPLQLPLDSRLRGGHGIARDEEANTSLRR